MTQTDSAPQALDETWKQRFRAPSIVWTQVAMAEPSRGIVGSTRTGTLQVHAWSVETGDLKQLTDRPGGMGPALLSPDGRYVYYLADNQGDEIGHFVRVPYEGGEPQDITPDLPPYSSWSIALSGDGRRIALLAVYGGASHLYVIDDTDAGLQAPKRIWTSDALSFGLFLTYDGDLAVVMTAEKSGRPEFSLLALDAGSGERIAELWDGEGTNIQAFAMPRLPRDSRVLASTNRSGEDRVLIWNPRTGERQDFDLEGIRGSAAAFDWSPDGRRFVFRTFNAAEQQFYLYDIDDRNLVVFAELPGTLAGVYYMPDGRLWGHLSSSTHPTRLVELDTQTGEPIRTVLSPGDVPAGRPWRSVTFPSSDGQTVQAWIATPAGNGPFPTILSMHGGPESVTTNSWSPAAQAWLDHGFAFMSLNYRGSTTFGRAFQEKIWGNLGYWEHQDMVAARQWLVSQGTARLDSIFLTGWSYGGYLTLFALGVSPDLWTGGMAGIAITDWTMLYEDSAETLRAYQRAIFGGTPEQKPEEYARSSPITYAAHVRAPVLIVQGRHDSRTPARPVEVYEEKMRALGKPITVQWFESGHLGAGADTEQSIQHQELMLDFARKALG
jgi:dipeptidyl aminopeptidase/acylaminoacyl peptidase